jgi:D-alanyl-D-alanine dipeptidase
MKKDIIYKELQAKMLRYIDLINIPVNENGELMQIINDTSIATKQISKDMLPITGNNIYVRKTVFNNLKQAGKNLNQYYLNYKLQVVYGYRALDIQTKLFEQTRTKLSTIYSGLELIEAVHKFIAVPNVAGHPTGGAVDVQIVSKNGKPLNFGTKIWNFKKDSYTFSPFISKEAQQNRTLLRNVMLSANFAPFDGEWWHFSYGDKEWAKYYNKPYAIYRQIEVIR